MLLQHACNMRMRNSRNFIRFCARFSIISHYHTTLSICKCPEQAQRQQQQALARPSSNTNSNNNNCSGNCSNNIRQQKDK
uniref:HDC09529 n=1 Tax=Drosophila melanogaster TaxID=7227 RepID=Q6ILE1_DROME|nr:TPA_inf: HDC09529 [Drosophila melanogaster]